MSRHYFTVAPPDPPLPSDIPNAAQEAQGKREFVLLCSGAMLITVACGILALIFGS